MTRLFKISPRRITIIIVIATAILLTLVWFGPRIFERGVALSYWVREIDRRGWRALYLNQNGNSLVAICDAGDNKIAVVDTDWPIAGFTAVNIGDSAHHGITAGEFELLTCNEWFHLNRVTGCIVRIKVPEDGRVRIVHQAGYFVQGKTKSGGEILLDVEVDWNSIQKQVTVH